MAVRSMPRLSVHLSELHAPDSGRIDAARIAEYLAVPLASVATAIGANYAAVHKTPDAISLQKELGPIKRTLELVSFATRHKRDARAWLNNPHPDLGGQTPLQVILDGHASAIVTLLDNALSGLPS
jgi:hypothetical protein